MTLRRLVGIATAVVAVAAVIATVLLLQPPAVTDGDWAPEPDGEIFDPRTQRGSELPAGYRPTVDRDAIRPIYDPRFVAGDTVDWPDETLVLGIAIEGEAKAYPVNVLNFREMVIDRLRGTPLLVSW